MIYLGLDTATTYLSLALSTEAEVLQASCTRLQRDHAKCIIGELDALLQRASLTRQNLAGIAVGIGPGSYTGLRVGIATAQGLARGLGISLTGVSTLAAIAHGQLQEDETAIMTLDARRGQVYAAMYHRSDSSLTECLAPHKVVLTELKERFPGYRLVQDAAPDASYCALQASLSTTPAIALYL